MVSVFLACTVWARAWLALRSRSNGRNQPVQVSGRRQFPALVAVSESRNSNARIKIVDLWSLVTKYNRFSSMLIFSLSNSMLFWQTVLPL